MNNPAPQLTGEEFARRFADIHPPFEAQAAVVEANRCLYCFDAPCTHACPTHIDIPRFIKKISTEVFDVMGRNPLLDIALEVERIALEDDYFVSRKLYPNVDFYTGLIYQSMGFPVTMFPVLFAIPRTSGWIAQWEEMLLDPEQKIARPRQIFKGHDLRPYAPIDGRS